MSVVVTEISIVTHHDNITVSGKVFRNGKVTLSNPKNDCQFIFKSSDPVLAAKVLKAMHTTVNELYRLHQNVILPNNKQAKD